MHWSILIDKSLKLYNVNSLSLFKNCWGCRPQFGQLQPDQINMAVFLSYLVKSDLSSLCYCTRVHLTSHFLKGTIKTRPCFTGHPIWFSYPPPLFTEEGKDKGLCCAPNYEQTMTEMKGLTVFLYRVVCSNFGHPALTLSITKYNLLQGKTSSATIVN